MWRHAVVEAIRHDPEWENGNYERQPELLAHILPLANIATGNPLRQYEKYPTRAAADAWYERTAKNFYEHLDTNDVLYRLDASSDYNPAPDLEKINAKLDRQMPRVKNGKYAIVHTGKEGNGEGADNINAKLWQNYLQDFPQSL